jgi:hypothetical protein
MDKYNTIIPGHTSRIIHISFSMLALIAGGLIYVLLRPAEPVFFKWMAAAGFENWLTDLRAGSLFTGFLLPEWMVYSLPNGLWAFAYTSLVLVIWNGSREAARYFWFLSIPVLVFGFELLQLSGTVQGTFCLIDIVFGALGSLAALLSLFLSRSLKMQLINRT